MSADRDPPDPKRYRVAGEIARGGMGRILEVWDTRLERTLAMKVLLPSAGRSSGSGSRSAGRFLDEAEITGQLDHPGAPPVHEVGVDAEGQLYFTMPLIGGRDLTAVYACVRDAAEGWTRTRALRVLLKVCETVASAHARGVIHRDLKPGNVMVGAYGETYVMDWGLARVLGTPASPGERDRRGARSEAGVATTRQSAFAETPDSSMLTQEGDVVGTPAYMSPEQARGELDALSPRSDVYSVGAMLYELLAGFAPYREGGGVTSPQGLLDRVLSGPPVPVDHAARDVPPELAAICQRALARDPAERYADMSELARDLRAFLEMRVVSAYRTGALAELGKWVERNRGTAFASAAAVVVLLAGLATSWNVYERAGANESRARALAADAQRERTKVLSLADAKKLDDLETEAAQLWPALPAQVSAYRRWLQSAEHLAERLDVHRTRLAEQLSGTGATDLSPAEADWYTRNLSNLVERLEGLLDANTGRIADVRARLESATTIAERTITGAEPARRWAEAIESIANDTQCPLYDGLRIEPQIGLLPLRRDPHSGLWEFAHLPSGRAPAPGSDGGGWELTERTGIVLVLLPGGSFLMGAQSEDPAAPNFDPEAERFEAPVHPQELAPFFIAKYEMTQAQWAAAAGENPSAYPAGRPVGAEKQTVTLLHPVESVSEEACRRVLGQLGLALPTEAQWEYAARGGTTTPWWSGAERESVRGLANLADRAASRAGLQWSSIQDWPDLDDGFAVHASVDAFPPNPYGLHGVIGNLQELCSDDWYSNYSHFLPEEERSGAQLSWDAAFCVVRGGSYGERVTRSRVSCRNSRAREVGELSTGVRPVLLLQ